MTAKNVARRPKKFFGNNFPLKSAAVAVFRVAILQSDFSCTSGLWPVAALLFDFRFLLHCGVSFKVSKEFSPISHHITRLSINLHKCCLGFFKISNGLLISVSLIVLSKRVLVLYYQTAGGEKLWESDLTSFLGYSPRPPPLTPEGFCRIDLHG